MEEEVEEGAPAWMATFADLMSLLLTFFVLLLSFASVDVMKFEGMIGSMKEAFGVKTRDPGEHIGFTDTLITLFDKEVVANDLVLSQEDALRGELRRITTVHQVAGSVDILTGKGGITVRVDGDLMFRAGQDTIAPEAFAFLDEIAAAIRQLPYEVSVEGHTDSSAPGKSHRSNLVLGAKRASSAAIYLIDAGDIAPRRVSVVSYGDAKPIRENDTEAHRAKNRRVEFTFHRIDPKSPRR
jgi:chemotaxis protein MotB